ncbi:YceI family protein [Aliiroseovarius sp. YM-037]|uniref:YceI family protein n=1 Tax=Aliiroseovarius sp. YM-037 TaxID=3341728 RepID=UPI003A7FE9EC
MKLLTILWLILLSATAQAAPVQYNLDRERSSVGFTYSLSGTANQGTMPVADATLMLDLDSLPQSSVRVVLNAQRARAGIVFATEAMRGPSVLDTRRNPFVTFESTRITGDLNRAQVDGMLTLAGTTRPITLTAGLYRQTGTVAGDRSRLSVLLTGQVSRRAFGAGGYPDLVDDRIDLRIIVRIDRATP